MLENGTIIKLDYTAKDKSINKIVDTNIEKEAKKAGIYNEKGKYTPLKIILGEHEIVKGLEEELMKMEEKEEKIIEVKPEKAYGERKAELIRVLPLQEFRKKKITPFPGLIIDANDMQGRVQTISGGRVRVDFNHPLAGKTIEFKAKINEIILDEKEKLNVLIEKFFPFIKKEKIKKEIKEKEIIIELPEIKQKQLQIIKELFIKTAKKCIKGKEIKIKEIKEEKNEEKTKNKEEKKNKETQEMKEKVKGEKKAIKEIKAKKEKNEKTKRD